MMAELGLFDAIYTARALRRLKPDPVPDELITKVLDAAIRAPSGGNAQNWIFLVVRDREQRHRLAPSIVRHRTRWPRSTPPAVGQPICQRRSTSD
jgi:nitroreductase